jgi:hypothetical protein
VVAVVVVAEQVERQDVGELRGVVVAVGQVALRVGRDVRPVGEEDRRRVDEVEVQLDADGLHRLGEELTAGLAEAGRRGAVLEDEVVTAVGHVAHAVAVGVLVAGRIEVGVGLRHVERRALRVGQLPVVARGGVGAGVRLRHRGAREDRLVHGRLVDGLRHRDADVRVLERRVALALAEALLVQVEVLVEPAGLQERLAGRRIDDLDGVVVGLDEVLGDVDLTGQEGGDLAVLVVRVVLVGDLVEARLAAAGLRRASPVVVARKLDRVRARGDVLERAGDRGAGEGSRDRVRLGDRILDRDGRHVVLREERAAEERAEPAGEGLLEVDGGRQAVRGHVEGVDLVPADLGCRVVRVIDPGPRVLEVVEIERLAVAPLEPGPDAELDGEATAAGIGDDAISAELRQLVVGRQVALPVAVSGDDREVAHRGSEHLAVGEGIAVVRVQLVGSLPVRDDDAAPDGPGRRLIVVVEEQRLVVDRRRLRARRR